MEKLLIAFFSLLIFNSSLHTNNTQRSQMFYTIPEEQYDGPYVAYRGNEIFVKYIMQANGVTFVKTDSIALEEKTAISLHVNTDIPGKSFSVQLKKELHNEQSQFHKVNKLLALSDIEGNFEAFRKLLLASGVVDENFNWTFGNGHLVLVGDFFDRGDQVTEVLWLIYYLEEKAKAVGGYVHFILGNHEIMNLSNDVRYTPQKYLDNAALLHENYISLYDANSELGRWLRTKNIIEKIGDILFTHGGISGAINNMNVSVRDINKLARPYYADTSLQFKDRISELLIGDVGPFWYRGYFDKHNDAIPSQIDSTLSQFGVAHIVTGHTIVSDTISVWYNGRLLNTDVHHAVGKSEALLIENDKYYRINARGNKVLLMEAH